MIYVALTRKEVSALRRSVPKPYGAASASHEREHHKAIVKLGEAENGSAQAFFSAALFREHLRTGDGGSLVTWK